MSEILDDLDKKIVNRLCNGTPSYEDLAKSLGVTRGTVYRRIDRLEKKQIILRKISAIPNFKKLNLSAIIIGFNSGYEHKEKIIEALKNMPSIKILWRAYGAHEAIAVLACEPGCEGETIVEIQRILSEFGTTEFQVSVGFKWEKLELSPY